MFGLSNVSEDVYTDCACIHGCIACHFWVWYIPLCNTYMEILVGIYEKGLSGKELSSPSL